VIPEDGLARAMENAQLAPLRRRNPGTSRKFALAIEKAMAVDPLDRYQSAEDFKRSLLASKSKTQQPVGAYAVTPPPTLIGEVVTEEPSSQDRKAILMQAANQPEPFLTPRKRQSLRASRRRRTILFSLAGLLFLGFISVELLAPGLIPYEVQNLRGMLQGTETVSTPIPTQTVPPSAQMTPEDAVVAALPTQAATSIPTPPGSEALLLAFASTRSGVSQIYITDLRGEMRQLTEMKEGACQPSWSPDGTRLVFTSPCKVRQDTYRGSGLYIINFDGSGLQPLNTVPGGDFEPAWSPDGRYIAFTSVRTGHMQIYSYDLRSGITQRLIRTPYGKDARQPSWSPDGETIAFSLRRTTYAFAIWQMTRLGRNQLQLVRSGDQVSDSHPEWSPDGKVLLFHRSPAEQFGFPRLVMLEMGAAYDGVPVEPEMNILAINNVDYSSDGFWLAFESMGDKGSHVYFMTVTGAEKTPIAPDPSDNFDPAWQPIPIPD
jgi:dipeptidyl aminopeptidase/acylaminoacyl peptidase